LYRVMARVWVPWPFELRGRLLAVAGVLVVGLVIQVVPYGHIRIRR
jgi:hypothetical protein